MMLRVDDILPKLENVRKCGAGWSARCPAHDDRSASLKIDEGEDSKLLLHCHAGCRFEKILATITGAKPARPKPNGKAQQASALFDGCSLAGYAELKKLPIEFLRELGVTETMYGPKPALRIPFKNEAGEEVFVHYRVSLNGEDKFRSRKGDTVQLYGLWRLNDARTAGYIVLCEGESDCHTLWFNNVPSVGLPGAKNWKEDWAQYFTGLSTIYVVCEKDKGWDGLQSWLAKSSLRQRVRVLKLESQLKDPSDLHIASGGDPEEFQKCWRVAMDSAVPWVDGKEEPPEDEATPEDATQKEKEKDTAAAKIVQAVQQRGGLEFFHDAHDAYVAVAINNHREVMGVRSRAFRLFVIRVNWELTGKIPSNQSITDALALMEAQSLFDGAERQVFVRIAPGIGGDIYLDLGDDDWRVVHITRAGWKVTANPPVYFRRPDSMRALPVPQPGRLDDLREFVNFADEESFTLFKAGLVGILRPCSPYVILCLFGQQGTAKTTTTRIARALTDPCKADVRTTPHDEDDLLIAARNCHLVAFDNVSKLPPWLSDAMCRVSTGGGLSKRQLYTDADEIVIEVRRPQLINGIEDLSYRGDFSERALTITLKPISRQNRRDEEEFWKKFEAKRPHILGGLLDCVASAIRQLPTTTLEHKPRMADFALFASAAEPVMAPRGAFMRAYLRNVELAQELVLESSLVAPHVIKLVDDSGDNWKGTTQELLAALNKRAHESGADGETKDKSWPKNPHRLGGILRRLAVALLAKGIRYTEPDRHTKARLLQLQRVGITKEPKAPKGNPQNGKDLSGADAGAVVDLVPNDNGTGADNGAVGADMVPNHFPEKGTTQPTENTTICDAGADGAFVLPTLTHNGQGDEPMCPKCFVPSPEKLAGGGNRCRACGHKFRDGDAFVMG